MFLHIDRHNKNNIAVKDDSGQSLTYGDVCAAVSEFEKLNLPRCVIFCLCENSAGSLIGYISFESYGQVPLLLSSRLDRGLRENLEKSYSPAYYWAPEVTAGEIPGVRVFSKCGYVLIKTNNEPYPVNENLSLLLTTSGSTGSSKLVRHKYGNLEANAENVATVFGWTEDDRGICDLPMNYTMGLNVINSHLFAGASILMIKANLMDPEFWQFIKEHRGTDFCGVPFSYEVMRRIGFDRMELPDLHTLAEGGGKLTDKMFTWVATYAKNNGKRFFATFGTTETSARMSYLDPDLALEKVGSIGKAIPDGELFLMDEAVSDDEMMTGELGYRGPNVTMGYARCKEDLMKGDEFCGEYHTGDIAKRDPDGFYFIIGRKGRFLKLFGLRVSLDECERLLKAQFPESDFVCTGDDRCMNIYLTEESLKASVISFIAQKTNLHNSAFRAIVLDKIPRNEYGKVQFSALDSYIGKL